MDAAAVVLHDEGACFGEGWVTNPLGQTTPCPGSYPAGFSSTAGEYVCSFELAGACFARAGELTDEDLAFVMEQVRPYLSPAGDPLVSSSPPVFIPPPVPLPGAGAADICRTDSSSMTYKNDLGMALATFSLGWEWCYGQGEVSFFEPKPNCTPHFTGYRCAPIEEAEEWEENSIWVDYRADGEITWCIVLFPIHRCEESSHRHPVVELHLTGGGLITCAIGDEYQERNCFDD